MMCRQASAPDDRESFMPLRYRRLNEYGTFFITTSTYKKMNRFNRPVEYRLVIDKIDCYRLRDNVKIHGYVVMPNHFHLLLSIPENRSISVFMRDLKKRIVYEYFQLYNSHIHKFWQHRFDDVNIYSENVFLTKLSYIHYNPVKVGFVECPEDWKYSSAAFYTNGEESAIKIEPIIW